MSLLTILVKILFDKKIFFDVDGDLRTISAATMVVGGVARFFGIHNQRYVIMGALVGWFICVFSTYFRGRRS